MEHYSEEEVEGIVEVLQDRLVASTVGAMVDQIEGFVTAFSPRDTMDAEAVIKAFTIVDRLVAEVMRRAIGSTEPERHERWLVQHVISVKRFLKAMAEDREVEVASIEKRLRDVLGTREQ